MTVKDRAADGNTAVAGIRRVNTYTAFQRRSSGDDLEDRSAVIVTQRTIEQRRIFIFQHLRHLLRMIGRQACHRQNISGLRFHDDHRAFFYIFGGDILCDLLYICIERQHHAATRAWQRVFNCRRNALKWFSRRTDRIGHFRFSAVLRQKRVKSAFQSRQPLGKIRIRISENMRCKYAFRIPQRHLKQ